MPSAEQSECVVESIDKIDGVVPCSFSVRGNLPRKVRALDRDRGDKQAANPPNEKKAIAKTRATAFVRLSVPRDILVTSGSSRYVRITAMATGIRIGWRKLTMLAAVQIAAPTTTMRRTTKQAVSAAHIVLRCHDVGYSFMLDG